MSRSTLIITTEEHWCSRCQKEIEIGKKAIKSVGRVTSWGSSWPGAVYVHEKCWEPDKRRE